ncbi:hypothetical protein BT69DRAFT_1277828 [Atractiella rhizophila]|nr:hypothetical protein BT69DRAFT_1277828 [Atractiella rhizophila]
MLITLPPELLASILSEIATLSDHVSFSQTCKSIRMLYDEERWKELCKRCYLSRPKRNHSVLSWSELASGCAAHLKRCGEVNICDRIRKIDIRLRATLYSSETSLAHISDLFTNSYSSITDWAVYISAEKQEKLYLHPTAYCQTVSLQLPLLRSFTFHYIPYGQNTCKNEDGVTVWDALDAVNKVFGRPLKTSEIVDYIKYLENDDFSGKKGGERLRIALQDYKKGPKITVEDRLGISRFQGFLPTDGGHFTCRLLLDP